MIVQPPKAKSNAARDIAAMAAKLGTTVPAAWPAGMAHLTQTYVACQRCAGEEAGTGWLVPDSIQVPPEFRPNGARFASINKAKSRG